MQSLFKRSMLGVTLATLLLAGVPGSACAGMIGTAEALRAGYPAERAAQLGRVEAGLARADVRAALERFGVDPAQAAVRAAALNDAELARLAGRIDALPAGGEVLAFVGLVFIVLLILDYTGVIHIFTHHH